MIPDFSRLKKNIKNKNECRFHFKMAVLADTATQLLCTAIEGYGVEESMNIDIYEGPYNQVEAELYNPNSGLYAFKPDYVLIFESHKKLLKAFYKTTLKDRGFFADNKFETVKNYYNIVTERLNAKFISFNFCEENDGVFGSAAAVYPASFLYQVRRLNFLLADSALKEKKFRIADMLSLQNNIGLYGITDEKIYVSTGMAVSIDALPYVAKCITDPIKAGYGIIRKCLILDLDNTVWGGVIGDDGINNIQIGELGIGKAFSELQQWIKELKNKGIILCVASKNTESIAKEPFELHDDMVLKLEDISVFMANWDNKVKNIQRIQEILNIGFDSMVFLDDNPFERGIVKQYIPEITVPDLPEDPSLYLGYLKKLNLFENISYSDNDTERTKQYQQEAKRVTDQKFFDNEEDFLKNLSMECTVEPVTAFNMPRTSQLTLRSNQFNLRTVRYDEVALQDFAAKENNYIWNFSLKDKYGDHGLIAIVMLEKNDDVLFIHNWIMSCRVLKRGMENFTRNYLAEFGSSMGCKLITGDYVPTPKNGIVKDHYEHLGFKKNHDLWELSLPANLLETFIKYKI
ncbi:MAG: HAD-IIIC family phosphatase [Chitinophagaceae bacterium]